MSMLLQNKFGFILLCTYIWEFLIQVVRKTAILHHYIYETFASLHHNTTLQQINIFNNSLNFDLFLTAKIVNYLIAFLPRDAL